MMLDCGKRRSVFHQFNILFFINPSQHPMCDIYHIVEEFPNENRIEITEYNSDTKEFRGIFRATFAIDENRTRCNPNAPDTIRFTNGQFQSKITR